jgi:hypothetical protein
MDLCIRASPLSVLKTLAPYIAMVLAAAWYNYYRDGSLSSGWVWTLIGIGAFILASVVFLPLVNYLEFTPQHFTVCQVLHRQQFAWHDIDPESITKTTHTLFFIPVFTKINLHTVRCPAILSSNSVEFMNIYESSAKIIEVIRLYQITFGSEAKAELP